MTDSYFIFLFWAGGINLNGFRLGSICCFISCWQRNDSIRRELQITCVLDKIDEYRLNWFLHLQRMPLNLEIIPLQTTRKTDNRKTEKTMERATMNLETERIKGSNP